MASRSSRDFGNAIPSEDPSYSNTTEDKVFLKAPKSALAGAVLGGGTLGVLGQVAGGGAWAAVGATVGGALGGLLGDNFEQLKYDVSGTFHYLGKRMDSDSRYREQSVRPMLLQPLAEENRRAHDSTGDIERAFDGYDSSRNITGLFSQEGGEEEPYRVAVELAHLRPLAEKDNLHTTLKVSTGKDTLTVATAANVDHKPVRVDHSVRFNQVIFEIDKEQLHERGWTDGSALDLQAETRLDEDSPVFDSVVANTDSKPGVELFRWEGKTIYQIMTDRFQNGDRSNDQDVDPSHHERFHGGDWEGVVERLDYLQELGVDCIWLSCPYENDRDFFGTDGYHGYWPHDFETVEQKFGNKEKLKELVGKAHSKGMKVMLDVVVNHTGYNHPAVRDPEFRDWFHRQGARNPLSQYGLENGSLAGLPDLAHENPKVSHYLIDVHKKWLEETDVDGFRVDAVRHVPGDFLQKFDSAMKADKEGFLTVGEVFWNDPYYLASYQNETQDSLFDFPLMQAVRDVFGGNPDQTLGQRWSQFQEVKQHNFGQAVMELTKAGGQSMQKLSKVLEKDHAYDNPRLLSTILDNHDTGRFLSHAGGDKSKLKLAAAFLYGCRGTPSLYYGTETGMTGQMGHNREDMLFDGDPDLRDHFKKLIHLRKASKALQLGSQTELSVNETTYAFSRVLPGEEVVCCYNNGEEAATMLVPVSETQLKDGDQLRRLDAEGNAEVQEGFLKVELPAKGFAFLEWQAS